MSNKLDNLNILVFKYAVENKIPKHLVIYATTSITKEDKIIFYRNLPYYFINLLSFMNYASSHLSELSEGPLGISIDLLNPNIINQIFLYLRQFQSDITSYDVYNAYIYNAILALENEDIDLSNQDVINYAIDNNLPLAKKLLHLLTIVNLYLEENKETLLNDMQQLLSIVVNWNNQLDEQYLQDTYYLNNIENVQKILSSFVDHAQYTSPLLLHAFDLMFNPRVLKHNIYPTANNNKEYIKVQDWMGIDIFNEIIVSREVFYVRHNDEYNNTKFKLYAGTDQSNLTVSNIQEKNLEYDKLLPALEDTNAANHIYLMLFLGDNDQNINDVSKEYVQLVSYNLLDNSIKVRIPIKSNKNYLQNYAINRLQHAFSFLDLQTPTQTNITAELIFWNWTFQDMVLFDAVLNQNPLQVYLYADETIKSFAQRKKVEFKYRSITVAENYNYKNKNLEITLSNQFTTSVSDQVVINSINQVVTQIEINTNVPYVRVLITEALSQDHISEFLYIFPLLVSYYQTIASNIHSTLIPAINLIDQLAVVVEGEKKKKKKIKHKKYEEIAKTELEYNSLELKKYAPDLFVANYNRRCKLAILPSIILPQNIATWIYNNPNKQYIPYPPPSVKANPDFYLTCMHKKTPYINIKYNQHLVNRATHPFIFCCHPNDRLQDPEANKRFTNYFNNNTINNNVSAKARNVLVTQRILPSRGLAMLPYNFSKLLNLVIPNVNFLRYGIILSPNSFIHALSTAVQDPHYINLTDTEKEDYVRYIRTVISKRIKLAILRQENFDQDEMTILTYLDNPELTLDPIRYYRLFEELYNVNIYIVGLQELGKRGTGQEHKDNNGQKVLHEAVLQLPRAKFFHYRVKRERPTVLIYRNFGSEADAVDHLQNELVVALNNGTSSIQTLYPDVFGNYCYHLLQNTYNMLQWQKDITGQTKIFYPIEQLLDYEIWLSYQGFIQTAQYIDDYGKLRVIVVKHNDIYISLIIAPSQPLNLPVINIQNLPVITQQICDKLFGISVDGYYALANIANAMYVLTDKHHNILYNNFASPSARLIKLRRTLSILKQLILWLFTIYLQQYNIKRDITAQIVTFYSNYFTTLESNTEDEIDSADIYTISELKRVLPWYQTVQDAIFYLSLHTNLIKDNKFVFYNKLFTKQMYDYLLYYTTSHSNVKIDHYLHDYYYSIVDYKQIDRVQIFFSIDELMLWLDKEEINNHKTNNPRIIHENISLYRSALYYPYFFKDINTKKLYIVQNVTNGDLRLALQIAHVWKEKSINQGYNVQIDNSFTGAPALIYSLSPIGTIISTINYNAIDSYLEILCYASSYQVLHEQNNKTFSYAALLPLN